MKLISVCIPTYEMRGYGYAFLKQSFDILAIQTFKDFDVVISDHSKTDIIKNLCAEYKNKLDIHYYKNAENIGNSSANINNAIKKAGGKLIKILFQDDFLYSNESLENIIKNFDLDKDHWLITACEHSHNGIHFYRPFYPKYNNKIHLGKNTISSPSVLTIKNENPLFFDEKLVWLMDCDYYKQCYDAYGEPKILNKINVVNRTGSHQVSNTIATKLVKKREYQYVLKKYSQKIQIQNVTLVAISSIKIDETIKALELSMDGINFHEAILISHEKPKNLPDIIRFEQCQPIRSLDEYSRFMAYDLARFIDSKFALVIQYDGYVVRPRKWNDRFLEYDYIGAPWPPNAHFTKDGTNVRVGNGGFSLRSKKLMDALNELHLPFTDNGTGFYNEDGLICSYYRKNLEDYGVRFAPVEVASLFSHEHDCEDSQPEPFGFHKNTKIIPTFFFFNHWLRKYRIKV